VYPRTAGPSTRGTVKPESSPGCRPLSRTWGPGRRPWPPAPCPRARDTSLPPRPARARASPEGSPSHRPAGSSPTSTYRRALSGIDRKSASSGSCTTAYAAAGLDRRQPRRPVVEGAREDHADGPGAVLERRGAEERVQRRPVPVLLRAAREAHAPILHEQVQARRRDVDAPLLYQVSDPRVDGLQRPDRLRMRGSALGAPQGKCTTTSTAAGRSAGSVDQPRPAPRPRRRSPLSSPRRALPAPPQKQLSDLRRADSGSSISSGRPRRGPGPPHGCTMSQVCSRRLSRAATMHRNRAVCPGGAGRWRVLIGGAARTVEEGGCCRRTVKTRTSSSSAPRPAG
jgi:hypothetical protein